MSALSILIADDDADICNAFAHVLNADGHFCETAQSGRDCIKKAGLKKFDLLVLDLILPDIGGEQILNIVRERQTDVAVIIVSADDEEEVIQSVLRSGATAYLIKPVDLSILRQTVARVADRKVEAVDSMRPARDTTW